MIGTASLSWGCKAARGNRRGAYALVWRVADKSGACASDHSAGRGVQLGIWPTPTLTLRELSSKARKAPKEGRKGKKRERGRGRDGGGSSNGGGTESTDYVMGMNDVRKTLPGGRVLFEGASLNFVRGAKIGVLGVNGSGKSTALKILASRDEDFEGSVWHRDGLKVKYLSQEPELDPTKDVMGNIREGLAEQEGLLERFEEVSLAMGEPDCDLDALLEEQAELQAKIDDLDAWSLHHRIEIAMNELRVPPADADVTVLSGGERRRVALCRLLLERPDVLMLDEPTNHLDAESVRWLEEYLQTFKGTVISITHDRYFLDKVASWILEVDRGRLHPYRGNYTGWLEQKQSRLDHERSKEAQTAKRLQSELAWINGRGKAGGARLKTYQDRLAESQESHTRLKQLEEGAIVIPPGPRLGQQVLQVHGVSKTLGGRQLFEDLSFTVEPGSVVGVVGPNGAGKSTLFAVMAGLVSPDQGEVEWGQTVKMGLVSQTRAGLSPEKTAYEEIAQGDDFVQMGDREVSARAYTAAFNLRGAAQEKRVESLSGGERNRVHLAKVLKEGHNVLLLDEPTNDLDVDTLRALEEAVREFPGCAVIISHDRWFLDRVCTHTLAFEGNGSVAFFPGNHSEYTRWASANGGAATARASGSETQGHESSNSEAARGYAAARLTA